MSEDDNVWAIDAATRRESSERLLRATNEDRADYGTSSEHGDTKTKLEESECEEVLGFAYSSTKKWTILGVIFLVQVSMNMNAAIYSNAASGISNEFEGVSVQKARLGQMVFLIAYGIGSELWAPWSEELGRWPVLQLSLLLVNLTQIPIALATSFPVILIFRLLGGLSSAGGSVTLGMISDMWKPEDQQHAVAFIVLSSVMGGVAGPILGGFVQTYLGWRWIFWISLIIGLLAQFLHFFIPETRTTVLVEREAKRRRESDDEQDVWAESELKQHRFSIKEIGIVWYRPFEMFFKEPIVLCLSLLSGFSDALIFTFLESFGPVFKQWGFSTVQLGLAFIPLAIGYLLAYGAFMPDIARQKRNRDSNPDVEPEDRLRLLLFLAPLETVGLIGFAWTSLGPAYGVPWAAPLAFAVLIGAANYAIYHATVDYMMAAYGEYSASATGGNALARDLLSGVAAMYSTPFYTKIPGRFTLEWPSTILAILAAVFTVPIYVFYANGPRIRERSVFAQTLADGKKNRTKKNKAV